MDPILWTLAVALILIGIAGTILPALPGAPLVFLGLLLAAWIDGFDKVGWFTLTVLAVLAILTFGIEFLATSMGAKKAGASKLAVVGAAVGTLGGLFLGIPGLILGPFLGAVAGEYITRRNWGQAGKVGIGTWIGIVLGTAGKLAVIFAMVGLFVLAYVI